jgi:mannitol/fructose-specific phosphotransferase system IIA component (Ntr-type)
MIHLAITVAMSYKADMSQNNSVPHAICSHCFDSFVLILHVHQPVRWGRGVFPPKT